MSVLSKVLLVRWCITAQIQFLLAEVGNVGFCVTIRSPYRLNRNWPLVTGAAVHSMSVYVAWGVHY